MSQHSSFVGLAVRWSREAGLMEDMPLQEGGGGVGKMMVAALPFELGEKTECMC